MEQIKYDPNSVERFMRYASLIWIRDFKKIYRHYLKTGEKTAVIGYPPYKSSLKDELENILSDTFTEYNGGIIGANIIVEICEKVEKKVPNTKFKKLSYFLKTKN